MANFPIIALLRDAAEVVYLFNRVDMLTAELPVVSLYLYYTRHVFMSKCLRLCLLSRCARISRSKGYAFHSPGATLSSFSLLCPIRRSVRHHSIRLGLCEQNI